MAQLIKFEAIGYRDLQGRYARRTEALATIQREEMRDMGHAGVSVLRHYAPKSTGKFAEGDVDFIKMGRVTVPLEGG